MSVDELRTLIEAAHNGPVFRKMSGPARSLGYRLAASTGLRFKEIARLSCASFRLSENCPTVTARVAYTKNGETATMDLPLDLAHDLTRELNNRPEGEPAFPLPISADGSSGKGAAMLRVDLAAAGIPDRDEHGFIFDFHALRCELATLLDLAGIPPRVVQKKMRHSSLELTGRSTRPRDTDMREAVNAVPVLRPEAEAQSCERAPHSLNNDASTMSFTPNAHHRDGGLRPDGSASGDQRTTAEPGGLGRKSKPRRKISVVRRPAAACHKNAPGWVRTSDLRFRRPLLYPAELRALGI